MEGHAQQLKRGRQPLAQDARLNAVTKGVDVDDLEADLDLATILQWKAIEDAIGASPGHAAPAETPARGCDVERLESFRLRQNRKGFPKAG